MNAMTITSSGASASDHDILRVGICQIYTEQWQIEQNFKRTVEALEKTADEGAILAITPECVLHGYGFSDDRELLRKRMIEVSEELSGERVSKIRALAKKLSLNIVLGIAERGADDKVHNSALFITQQGEIAEVYRKVHCRRFESVEGSGAFTPGDRFAVAELSYWPHDML
jgi:predicted amidohydrolase